MRLILLVVTILALCTCAAVAQAQIGQAVERPNFSGTWEFVGSGSNLKDRVLVITHSGDEIVIEDRFVFEKKTYSNKTTLYADKRGESNLIRIPGGDAPTEIKSRTAWEKNKLVRRSQFDGMMELRGQRYRQAINEDQTYSLSEDGNTLTVRANARRETPFSTTPLISSGKSTFRRKS